MLKYTFSGVRVCVHTFLSSFCENQFEYYTLVRPKVVSSVYGLEKVRLGAFSGVHVQVL